jgi:hypothetical protein
MLISPREEKKRGEIFTNIRDLPNTLGNFFE